MHYLSKSAAMSFEDAVAATKEALKYYRLAILAEIDLGKALRRELAVDCRPYVILNACSPPLARRAIELDGEVGSILLCNVVVRDRGDGLVEISAVDPLATIGTINHVEFFSVARELRSLLQQVIDAIEPFRQVFHDRPQGQQLARALPKKMPLEL